MGAEGGLALLLGCAICSPGPGLPLAPTGKYHALGLPPRAARCPTQKWDTHQWDTCAYLCQSRRTPLLQTGRSGWPPGPRHSASRAGRPQTPSCWGPVSEMGSAQSCCQPRPRGSLVPGKARKGVSRWQGARPALAGRGAAPGLAGAGCEARAAGERCCPQHTGLPPPAQPELTFTGSMCSSGDSKWPKRSHSSWEQAKQNQTVTCVVPTKGRGH